MYVVGVDGWRDGWIVVAVSRGQFAGAKKLASFAEVLEVAEGAVAIGVDLPIGLLPESMRVCDALARKYVGERRSGVFLTPPRRALEALSFDEANSLCRMLTNRELSPRAFKLRSKIFEVEEGLSDALAKERLADALPMSQKPANHPARLAAERVESAESLRKLARIIEPDGRSMRRVADALPAGRVVEVHPECSFRLMAGSDLTHSRKSYNGMVLRRELLSGAGIDFPEEREEIGGVPVEETFDAAAAAWSAHRYAIRRAKSLPPRELWQFDNKRPIAIWM